MAVGSGQKAVGTAAGKHHLILINKMKNLFIPYELAIKAKEMGFNEECLATQVKNGTPVVQIHPVKNSTLESMLPSIICVPIYQQIVDWFREKHQIEIAYKLTGSNHRFCWVKNESKPIEFTKGDVGGYYGAFNKAIEESFKLI